MELELPPDFPHKPFKNYTYEVKQFNRNFLAIWICNHGIFSYTSDIPKSIWGFYNTKTRTYFSPVNFKTIGKEVDITQTRNYTAMRLNLNPLELALYV
tara:strand:- start:253 stop:546 length:294 start_codon:yes stop_codon:yes gene_type:complete